MGQLHKTHSYLQLPSSLYSRLSNNKSTYTIDYLNNDVLQDFDLLLQKEDNQILFGNHTDIFAMAYAGHQYGHFAMLGDGRAMMLGEIHHQDHLYDLHVKGSGPTPYSRRGDGHATMLSSLKEYLLSEAMHHLGVPTTRPFAVLSTNRSVLRETVQDGSMLLRVAQSHIRIGTIEYARALQDKSILGALLDYTIQRLYPECNTHNNPYLSLFKRVVEQQAKLVALWQSLGFVHGVLNTDNVLLSGETIDYGPCAFLDEYAPSTTFSSIDRNGRYAYFRQPFITSWNLSKLAAAMLQFIDQDEEKAIDILNDALSEFEGLYTHFYYQRMTQKLGITTVTKHDIELVDELLSLMEQSKADYTNTFYHLTTKQFDQLPFSMVERTLFLDKWQKRNPDIELMKTVNPVVIPRNHLVLEALESAAFDKDHTTYKALIKVFKEPYNYNIKLDKKYTNPNPNKERFITYCGT